MSPKTLITSLVLSILCTATPFASFASEGGSHGGGGDASEMGVDEIRADILNWILAGGASTFSKMPDGLSPTDYAQKMTAILAPHRVIIGFVTTKQERLSSDPEMRVIVNGQYKSCRGFISVKDRRPHVLCNRDRFPSAADDQYRLIHHEFAGLAGVEKNVGASSDYTLSEQLTKSLVPQTIYRLAVKGAQDPYQVVHFQCDVYLGDGTYDGGPGGIRMRFSNLAFDKSLYEIAHHPEIDLGSYRGREVSVELPSDSKGSPSVIINVRQKNENGEMIGRYAAGELKELVEYVENGPEGQDHQFQVDCY